MARDLVGDEPFAVMLGDDIIDAAVPCMRQMMDVFEQLRRPGDRGAAGAARARSRPTASSGGDPEGDSGRLYRIRDLVEKPEAEDAPSDLAIIGRYILTPDIFEELERTPRGRGGRDPAHRRPAAPASSAGRSTATSSRACATTPATSSASCKATVEFALKRDDLGGPFREYLKSLTL